MVLQNLRSALARTPVRARGSVSLAKGHWRVGGGLDWLSPYRPFVSVAIRDFELRFGPRHPY